MSQTSRSRRRALRYGLIAAIIALLSGGIVWLANDVSRQIDDLATANSDNLEYALSQVEVEFFALENAVLRARTDPGPGELAQVRRRFDIFYSRVSTLRDSALYAPLRQEEDFQAVIDDAWAFLQLYVPEIDGDDARLAAALPTLDRDLAALRPDLRTLGIRGIARFSLEADSRRAAVGATLQQVAFVAFALMLALLGLVVTLLALIRRSQRAVTRTRMTSSRLSAVISTSLDGVLVVNRQGLILDFNGAAETIFGYPREEAIGRPMAELIVPDHMRAAHDAGMKRYLDTGERKVIGAGRVQLEAMRKSGEVFPVELSISTAQSEVGEIFVSFIRDISARVAAEQELMRARDDALAGEKAKADLLAVMSHEMRTPLNGLLGTMELLDGTALDAAQRNYLRIMGTSGELLLHHVNDVLDISRLDSGMTRLAIAPFHLPKLLQDLVDGQRAAAEAAGNQLTLAPVHDGIANVQGDAMRLQQVLLNLVGNAIKFTRNGEIAVEVDHVPATGELEFRVTDTGIGIPEHDLERIFEDFVTLDTSYSRRTGGTGLGLGITRRTVAAMGGTIGVESEAGEGSLFWVRLPLPATTADTAVEGEDALPEPEVCDVLIVEDNAINRTVARAMLERFGHRVDEAEDGAQGVAAAERCAYDLILMDISMPTMDGVQATKAIREGDGASRNARIVALTAHALPADIKRFRAAGLDDTLIKPISRQGLARILGGTHAAEAAAGPPLIREDVVIDLADQLGDAHVARLIDSFLAEGDATVAAVPEDLEKAAAALHRLAGSAGVFGAAHLGDHLARLETLARDGRSDAFAAALPALQPIWERTRAALEAR
ncbi:hybrid sensor histidine kinase/response regulator [Pontivivens ytuae]|uniref:histidine kinase n=1 Tax=Pontivivens ytuae TaxID=2789856 RepID=A0A7S9LU21_9RHOB|nr:PAS domain-containing hybrid sensor histidine kinase/response regulator [Pontivivens ytuae]QPH55274.1 PAS domain S-box protein [Pontivivens ytuae]